MMMCSESNDEYVKMGSPTLWPTEVRFSEIGSPAYVTLGKFETEIEIDGYCFPIRIRMISDTISRHRLLIGTDFLEPRNFHATKGTIYINLDDEKAVGILQINVFDEEDVTRIDFSHIQDKSVKKTIIKWIKDYTPEKMTEMVSLRLCLRTTRRFIRRQDDHQARET